ncbi:DUF5324 family protein [Streptomyces sp. ISL-10]|uniref:DUF5324 family protein n=1 Tax=Streptomyces sp. ISL-10 TaxID=2819172 RepID=UPI002035D253|nr:DUF5324 family protein [Streptomyces sp. ISL-10]
MASADWLGSVKRRVRLAVRSAGPPGFQPGRYCPFCGCRLSKARHHPACPVASEPGALLNALLRRPAIAAETERLLRPGLRSYKGRRLAKSLIIWAAAGGAAFAAWQWWDKQTNPDWLVEPPGDREIEDHQEAEADLPYRND